MDLLITVPEACDPPMQTDLRCEGRFPLATDLACRINGQRITVDIKYADYMNPIAVRDNIAIKISPITNPHSTHPSAPIVLQVRDSIGAEVLRQETEGV